METAQSKGGLDPISTIVASIANLTGNILGFISNKKDREFQAAVRDEETNVQAFIGKFERWWDNACADRTTMEKIMFNENSRDGDQIRAAGSVERWISDVKERDRAYQVLKSFYPEKTLYKIACPGIDGKIIMPILYVAFFLIIIFLITKALKSNDT